MLEQYEIDLVTADLVAKGITNFDLREGNDCVWASYGRVDAYYVIRNNEIVDVIYD